MSGKTYYNMQSTNLKRFASDKVSLILGNVTLRQIRVRDGEFSIFNAFLTNGIERYLVFKFCNVFRLYNFSS
jgi:hypothetical protein